MGHFLLAWHVLRAIPGQPQSPGRNVCPFVPLAPCSSLLTSGFPLTNLVLVSALKSELPSLFSLSKNTIKCSQKALLSSWVSIYAHIADSYAVPTKLGTQNANFYQKKISFHFANPPICSFACKVKPGNDFHKRYWPNEFQSQTGMWEIKDGS